MARLGRSRTLALGAVAAALVVAGCGSGSRDGTPARVASSAGAALPSGWRALRLASGASLPYPPGWRRVAGDRGTASAALLGTRGTIRAYLNATPAQGTETLADWARFRPDHNTAEGDRHVRVVSARSGVRLRGGRASCVIDDYATSRSRYREMACIVAPPRAARATVVVAAAQPAVWAHERPLLDRAIDHFTS